MARHGWSWKWTSRAVLCEPLVVIFIDWRAELVWGNIRRGETFLFIISSRGVSFLSVLVCAPGGTIAAVQAERSDVNRAE